MFVFILVGRRLVYDTIRNNNIIALHYGKRYSIRIGF